MEKAFEMQKQIRDNAKTLNSYMTDLQNWEAVMKRKEAALSGESEQSIPPVRSKAKKEKPVQVKKKPEPRILSCDYRSWEKFDVDKACEDIDMIDFGLASLDSRRSKSSKMDKFRIEAQQEKDKGNNFVKQGKWNEAISCYSRAIELVKTDAIYYANRGLCHLKNENLHQAEADCTEALRLEPTYVKALQRRAASREKLGALRAACADLVQILNLEPRNREATAHLANITARMATKGNKSKSSPLTTPYFENKPIVKDKGTPKIKELEDPPSPYAQYKQAEADNWRNGVGENVTVLKPVKKPPHLRSKRPLKPIVIQEIQLGKSSPEKPPTRLQIVEMDSKENGKGDTASPESVKLVSDVVTTEKQSRLANLVPPTNSVQFMAEWKNLSGANEARSDYFSIIDPSKIPSIFANALESNVLSELLRALHDNTHKFKQNGVAAYLSALTRVKRFSALAMFLSTTDKQLITELLVYCKNVENCADQVIVDLKKKYEV